jgi:hypothetical protein
VGISLEFPAVSAYASDPALRAVLARLVRNLAPDQQPVLRIGGDSTDFSQLAGDGPRSGRGIAFVLTRRWLATLGSLVHEANARTILGINLEQDDVTASAAEARALVSAVGPSSVMALEIGNEPEFYNHNSWYVTRLGAVVHGRSSTYGVLGYLRDFTRYAAALPSYPLAGPATGGALWLQSLAPFIRRAPRLGLVTVHLYPLQRCVSPEVPEDERPSIANLLAPTATVGLAERALSSVEEARARGLEVRVDEMNSVACRGSAGISDTFASSLWILASLLEMAKEGVAGVNIHTLPGAVYQPFELTATGGGPRQWTVTPMYYGMLAFADAVPPGSQLLKLGGEPRPGISTWAVLTPNHLVNVIAINEGAQAATIPVAVPRAQGAATITRLQAPSLTAPAGVTLGGASFGPTTSTGVLSLAPALPHLQPVGGTYEVRVPAASAVVVGIPVQG